MGPIARSHHRSLRSRLCRWAVLLTPALLMLAPGPAVAGYLGRPDASTPLYAFENGFDMDRTQRTVYVASPSNIDVAPTVTFNSTRYLVRESYGWGRVFGIPVNVDALLGFSLAKVNFGTVIMQTGPSFWETYAPGTTGPGENFRGLSFGQSYGASYGAAIRGKLFKWKGGQVGVGAQLLKSASTDTRLPAMRLRYNEWDAFLGAMHTGPFIGFYYGVNASALVGELKTPDPDFAMDLEQMDLFGVYAGMDFRFYRNLSFGTELRIMNQLSYSARMTYHY
ncbi:MAG: hypothetical protein OEY97_07070 [Nitrospirota bacterium]|nr:hypothetical protein [Nitrospirota bacterium]